jgi:hypothetical protein
LIVWHVVLYKAMLGTSCQPEQEADGRRNLRLCVAMKP